MSCTSARRDDRDRHRDDGQHGRGTGDGGRRGNHRHDQVRHEHVQGLRVRVLQQREAERERRIYFGRGAVPAKLPDRAPDVRRHARRPDPSTTGCFSSASYEGYRAGSNSYAFYSVPDAALRNGDFSNALNTNGTLQRIYDPMIGDMTTGNGRAAVRQQRDPGEPDSIRSRRTMLAPVSAAERRGHGRRQPDQQLSASSRKPRPSGTTWTAKVNWNRTPAHQFWGKSARCARVVDDLFTFPIGESDDDGGHTNAYQVTAGQTWSVGPTLLAGQLVRHPASTISS